MREMTCRFYSAMPTSCPIQEGTTGVLHPQNNYVRLAARGQRRNGYRGEENVTQSQDFQCYWPAEVSNFD